MPPDIILTLRGDDQTTAAFNEIKARLADLDRLEERYNQASIKRDIAKRRHLEALANARAEGARALRAEFRSAEEGERTLQRQIQATIAADNNRTQRLIQNSMARQARVQAEADVEISRNKRLEANARVREATQRRIAAQERTVQAAHRETIALEKTTQLEIQRTTKRQEARDRRRLERLKQLGRERDREFRREERQARERFIRDTGYGQFGGGGFRGGAGSGFAAGLGAGIFSQLQNIAGQLALFSGGIYVLSNAFSGVVRDRARVQRLEVGVQDLTDAFRAQAILPRLQEIALLPGLDYVTATQAFTRALSGGFTDQQSLRLINQVRNAVALSQGSIEDTNEVLRQFIQIQARDRFDQENLRPILERAPFIRRVIQAEFGTQIGGDIQTVLESRGQTTTEGILAIVERLAQGPVADPTTLQNALDNVGNELILLRNELGRRIGPTLRFFVDETTRLLRFLQEPGGQILTSGVAGAGTLGLVGLIGSAVRGRRRDALAGTFEARGGLFRRAAYEEFLRGGRRTATIRSNRTARRTFLNELVGYVALGDPIFGPSLDESARERDGLDQATGGRRQPFATRARRIARDFVLDAGSIRDVRARARTQQSIRRERGVAGVGSIEEAGIRGRLFTRLREFEQRFIEDPEFANRAIGEATRRFDRAEELYRQRRARARSTRLTEQRIADSAERPRIRDRFTRFFEGVRLNRNIRRVAQRDAGVTPEDLFIRESLLLGPSGQVSSLRRLGALAFGRPGERRPFFGGGPLTIGTPSLIGIGAGIFGGATLGSTIFERAGRNQPLPDNTLFARFSRITIAIGDALSGLAETSDRLINQFNVLSDSIQNLNEGGIKDFGVLVGDLARSQADITRRFTELQSQTVGASAELNLRDAQFATNNPLLEYIVRNTRLFRQPGFNPEEQDFFDRVQRGQGAIDRFRRTNEPRRNQINQTIDLLEQRIRRLPAENLVGPAGRRRLPRAEILQNQERERQLEEINAELATQREALAAINTEEERLVQNLQRIRNEYNEITPQRRNQILNEVDPIIASFTGFRAGIGPLRSREQRNEAFELFRAARDLRTQIVTGTETAATTRQNIFSEIRRLERNLLRIEPVTPRRDILGRTGFRSEEERQRYELIQNITQEIEKQRAELERVNEQERLLVDTAQRLRDQYGGLAQDTVLLLRRAEDYIGTLRDIDPIIRTLRGDEGENIDPVFSKESLENLNLLLEIGGHATVTYNELADTLREVDRIFGDNRDEFRQFRTGLGAVRVDAEGNRVDTGPGVRPFRLRERIEGIIPRGGRDLPEGGESTGNRFDPSAGRRAIIRTGPNFLNNLGASAEQARRSINGAIDAYRRIRTAVQGGAPPDPRYPTGVLPIPGASGRFGFNIPGEPASGIRSIPSVPIIPRPVAPLGIPRDIQDEVPDTRVIDNINANRRALENLGEEFQNLERILNEFNRERVFNIGSTERVREIRNLIIQTDQLRSTFESLRPAIQASIDALPENNPLRQQLERLINVPVDQLTDRLRRLREELQLTRDELMDLREIEIDERIRLRDRDFQQLSPGNRPVTIEQIINHPYFVGIRREQRERRLQRARAFEGYFAGGAESIYDQFIAPPILDSLGIGESNLDRGLRRLREDIERQRAEIRRDETLSQRDQNDALLELNREYLRERRDLERQYEEEREDAWENWVRQQLTDFPKLIFQQLNLQLAARATNFVLNSLGLGGNIPITGPGIPGGAGYGRLAEAAGAGGVGLGQAAGTAGVAFSAYQAGRGIYEVGRGGGFNDIFQDIANIPSSIGSFFTNLSFHNPINDAIANAAGRARGQEQAARLGRESARDIVRHYDQGFEQGSQQMGSSGNTYMISGNTTFNMPIEIGDREIRQISFTMDEMISNHRL